MQIGRYGNIPSCRAGKADQMVGLSRKNHTLMTGYPAEQLAFFRKRPVPLKRTRAVLNSGRGLYSGADSFISLRSVRAA
jgi:hypothetical protein